MANIQQRAGEVRVRVGGNTQEMAKLVDSLPDGRMLAKDIGHSSNPVRSARSDIQYANIILRRKRLHWIIPQIFLYS